jgi:hypothetical protein
LSRLAGDAQADVDTKANDAATLRLAIFDEQTQQAIIDTIQSNAPCSPALKPVWTLFRQSVQIKFLKFKPEKCAFEPPKENSPC